MDQDLFWTNEANSLFFHQNHALLEKKDPGLSFLTHTFEASFTFTQTNGFLNLKVQQKLLYDHPDELGTLDNLDQLEVIYIFGLGLGYSYLHLREKTDAELIFIEEDPSIFLAFLHTKLGKEMLQDERVHFDLDSKGVIEKWSHRFPVKKVEVLLSPHINKTKRFEDFRLEILRKTTLSEGLYLDRLYSMIPFQNFLKNLKNLPSSFFVNRMKGAFQNIPAIITGAGPSLDESIELLRRMKDRALILAGGSSIPSLTSRGIIPHLGVALDPNLEEYYRLRQNFAFEMPILYSSRVHPHIFCASNGPAGYLRSALGQLTDLWMEEAANLEGSFVGSDLPPESMTVTTTNAALAEFLGCNPIIFVGVDLAYTENKRYADGVLAENSIDKKELGKKKVAEDHIYEEVSVKGKKVITCVKWLMERDALSLFSKRSKGTFINASSGLKMKEIPYQELSSISFEKCYNLEGWLHAQIEQNRIAFTKQDLRALLSSLEMSVIRCQNHLSILQKPPSYGHKALAEIELKEERAYQILFYDLKKVLKTYFRKEKDKEEKVWSAFYQIVKRYRELIRADIP